MLVDSNILIYACQVRHGYLRQFIEANMPSVSVISKVETFGYHHLPDREKEDLGSFFGAVRILLISERIADQAILLRQQRLMSLGDSLIAGTALAYGLTLVTHNVQDFEWIDTLNLLDPVERH